MKALTFTLRRGAARAAGPLAADAARACGPRQARHRKIRLGQSKRASAVGDIFRVAGNDPGTIVFDGGSSRFDRLAAA